jgi:hypothetical protein
MAIPLTALAAGAVVALLIGVFGKVHDPSLDGTTTLSFDTVIDMKVVVSTLVGGLAVLQVIGALSGSTTSSGSRHRPGWARRTTSPGPSPWCCPSSSYHCL